MKRVELTVAYDGTHYHGWQIQNNGITIEAVLNSCLKDLTGETIKVTGGSRTDAGVHAMMNVAVFDTAARMPGDKFSYALNQRLPEDIRIRNSREVAPDFHPRKCRSRKTYEYRIINQRFPVPVRRLYTQFIHTPLDVKKMDQAAQYLVGEHDFKSFCSIHTEVKDTVRRIYSLAVFEEDEEIVVSVCGNGFLYHMVRIIAGTLIQVGRGEYPPEKVGNILKAKERSLAGPTAPAKGLILKKYEYDPG